jgi:2-polyprenyl-6-methoxyphenol hydroxylase-like FAD-dependent oxidoreductase
MMQLADFCIVGAGSAGLFLANLLGKAGKTVLLFDENLKPNPHSRSIGIHPPSLELLDTLNLADTFVKQGNPITSGNVYLENPTLPYSELSFLGCKKPYNYVLSLPQYQTETILEENLKNFSSVHLFRGCKIEYFQYSGSLWQFQFNGSLFKSPFLIDASGKKSQLRSILNTTLVERAYQDTYLMGDTLRTEEPPHKALIYLTPNGVIESFPLPNGIQRWVFKTAAFTKKLSFVAFADWIRTRTGITKDPEQILFTNGFGVQKGICTRIADKHFAIVGDAAHIVSPIGGQGMNLAWFNSFDLANLLQKNKFAEECRNYEKRVRLRWKKVVFRSEFNMFFGRASSKWLYQIKKVGAKQVLKPRFAPTFANQFTMRGIDLPLI